MSLRDVKPCGARTRFGTPCRQPGMRPSGRCRMHGGRTPRGIANPNTKTGRYSQDLPTRLLGRYENLMTDDTLLSLRSDIALLGAAAGDELAEIKKAEAEPDAEAIIGMAEKIAAEWTGWDWTRMNRECEALVAAARGRQNRQQAMASVRSLIRDKAALIAQENKLLEQRDAMIPLDQVVLVMRALAGVVRREVRDPDTLRSIQAEFARVVQATDQPKMLR
jgi:hypothetical protein